MNWIRVSVEIGDDPRVHALADAAGVPVATAVGCLVLILRKMPAHAPSGDLSGVTDGLLESWAMWPGRAGRFAPAFRAGMLDESGVWASWEKHNGRALKKLERDRERIRLSRESRADSALSVAGLSRDGRPPVAGTDGRTDEVPTAGAHARRNGNGHHAPQGPVYAPGHANVPTPAPCLDGCELRPVEGQKRPLLRHVVGCPNG